MGPIFTPHGPLAATSFWIFSRDPWMIHATYNRDNALALHRYGEEDRPLGGITRFLNTKQYSSITYASFTELHLMGDV